MTKLSQATAHGKINLHLGVGAAREDGYHDLVTVFQSVDTHDTVTLREDEYDFPRVDGSAAVSLECDSRVRGEVPEDPGNLAWRAFDLVVDDYADRHGARELPPVSIRLDKRIPVAGGMAGGSADAAGALVALNKLWDLGFGADELERIAADLGSDVPFALKGSVAHGQGRGELLEAVQVASVHAWVFLTRSDGLSTPAVFREFDRLNPQAGDPAPTTDLRAALESGSIDDIGAAMVNDLEEPAASLNPELGQMLGQLRADGLHAILSGSGPTIAVLTDPDSLHAIAQQLAARYPHTTVLAACGPAAGAHVREAE